MTSNNEVTSAPNPGSGRVLLTGASGALGRILAPALAAAGHQLTLTDRAPFSDPLPEGAVFRSADLSNWSEIENCSENISTILHFGGISVEGPAEPIHAANVTGTYHVFELARARGVRVVFASSNHTIGFYPRSQSLSATDSYRPDGYYGLSKVYGELLGRLYFDKHGVESVHLRIGSCIPQPRDTRHLSTWLSYPDLLRLVQASILAPRTDFAIVWGISQNTRRWWFGDDAERIGYIPQDDAEEFAGVIGPEKGDAVSLACQGGPFCGMDYSRVPSSR